MLEKLKKHIFPVVGLGIGVVAALFWLALRVNYAGISKFLGADKNQSFLIIYLPVMVCVLAWFGVALSLAGLLLWQKRRWPAIAGFVIGMIVAVGSVVVVCFGAWDYLDFIMVHFWRSLGVTAAIAALTLVLFFPVKGHRGLKWLAIFGVIAVAIVWGYGIRTWEFTYGAVVYAVEDTYQIVFSTSDSAVAWVTVGEENYYDLYAGSSRSADRVHKVTVPQAALDAAGGYTVHAQQMIYRGPFGGYKGTVLSQSYDFRPVDASDGLNYVSMSDVHGAADAAAKAAVAGEPLDFIVLLGDLVSLVETEADAQYANYLAHQVTGGEIPVIYARGNHEIKGEYAEVLYKYVGSLEQGYSYTVTLGDAVYAVVLDLGEDHEDDWWEYYGTAQFDLYRQQQTELLQQELEAGVYENYEYRMAICHIPVVIVDKNGLFEQWRTDWTEMLNEMEVDICLSGHKHEIWYFLPDTLPVGEKLTYSTGYAGTEGKKANLVVTDHDFPAFLVGQRSLGQNEDTQKLDKSGYMCLHTAVDLAAGNQVGRYLTSHGDVVQVFYPWVTDQPGYDQAVTEIVTELN